MGMTIDDHIEVLKSYNNGFTGYAGNLQDSINVAIDTMRKYQQIQEIYQNYKDRFEFVGMQQIGEVIEDGTNSY